MAYATAGDFIDRYSEAEAIQLTDVADPPTGQLDYSRLNMALEDASNEMDLILLAEGCKTPLPLSNPPAAFNQICTDIARFRLYDDHASEEAKRRYDLAVDLLKRIAKTACNALSDEAQPTFFVKTRESVLSNIENRRLSHEQ